ncbi:carboxymuconolactone decarboxylase family protein [Micromonospora sp. PLK6-60]|uniref:carboxymuconolactone decarboxylase family protein n=1 Tax=Micromonospora sp. PLK6-60 TaxID=2873383 RepID=UPI001CA6EE26|nr:carboxymuconolactone decarboxylase family protein [Micromonospora sp. PLK6-60]MBY8870794.1 carboxymuconolactone decarboxylase family protein [Micromonospora sp. PLK6-60]
MASVFLRASRRSSLAQIRYVEPVRPGTGGGLVNRVYDQVERDFGMLAPPIALHSPAPDVLAAAWLMLRETLVATGRVDRPTKEAVGTAVSRGNACPYCVEVHSATLDGLTGTGGPVADAGRREVVAWAAGCATAATADSLVRVPFPAGHAAELVGVVVTFHYLNRMVNVFLRESPFPSGLPAPARGGLLRLLVRILRPVTRAPRRPGDAADLLPAAAVPDDLGWTAGSPHVADAFARAAAAVEAAAARHTPAAVRELVLSQLAGWHGEPPGVSRAWATDAVAGLAVADRPAGRLALLTVLASYQVSPPVVDDCRAVGLTDEALIALTSWASLTAARRVGGWTWDSLRGHREFSGRP